MFIASTFRGQMRRIACLVGLGAAMSSACDPATSGEDRHATKSENQQTDVIQVMAADIPERVQILGDLGYPIYTVLQVDGTWENPPPRSKDSEIRFRVTHVNGRKLEPSREFSRDRVRSAPGGLGEIPDPTAGDTWHVPTCVESGGMVGFPPHVWEEFDVRLPMMPYNGRFMTHLYLSDEVQVENATDNAQ